MMAGAEGPAGLVHPSYEIRECQAPECRLRFPVTEADVELARCPRCGGPLTVVVSRMLVRDTRTSTVRPSLPRLAGLLDNIRSIYNTGSIFRTSDGAGLEHLYLCGITATPQHRKLAKTALGTEARMGWSYHPNALDAAAKLVAEGYTLWAMEDGPGAHTLFESATPDAPLALIVGNEVTGVDPGLLELCDRQVVIPMYGVKRSLNVATAFGVAVYWFVHRQPTAEVQT